jgi:2-polyprenyl-3-methyl-5-hydroxy-6-metoxy-1,4-benzoquinol methylase
MAQQDSTQYALGHSEEELERLTRQARAFEPFTRRFLQEAGIAAGMRVLDVGSGSGDVAFLVSELVGPTGTVIGTDASAEAVHWAGERAKLRKLTNVVFVEGDPTKMHFEEAFDAVVGRLVLMYYPDPVDAVRKLAGHVREGGLLAFHEFDCMNCRSLPPAPTFERTANLIRETMTALGAKIQLGLDLYSVFLDAGLPGPSMEMSALIGGGRECIVYDLIAEVARTLLPLMEKLHLTTAADMKIDTLAERIREEVVAGKGIVLYCSLIGACSQKRSSVDSRQ